MDHKVEGRETQVVTYMASLFFKTNAGLLSSSGAKSWILAKFFFLRVHFCEVHTLSLVRST